MYANGGASDANFGRYGNRGGGGGGQPPPPPPEEDFFGNNEAEYRSFQYRPRARNRKRARGLGGLGSAPEADVHVQGEEVPPPQPRRYVPLDRMKRSFAKAAVVDQVKKRRRAREDAERFAEGNHALGDDADDMGVGGLRPLDDSVAEESTSVALIGNQQVLDNETRMEVRGELAAARVHDDAMLYSSCSDDEMVLKHTLRVMHNQVNMAQFEEDNPQIFAPHKCRGSHKHKHAHSAERVPDNVEDLFAQAEQQQQQNSGGASSASDDDEDDEGSVQVNEREASRRERVQRLRLHVHNERKRRGNPPEECFKCMWGNSQYDAVNAKAVYELFRLMESEVGRRDLRAVAKTVHKFYKHSIYLPLVAAGKKIFMWRTRTIYEHLTSHDFEPRIMLYQKQQRLKSLEDVLINETHVHDPQTQQTTVHPPNVRLLLDVMKLQLAVSKEDPSKMIFFDERAALDLASAGAGVVQQQGEGGAVAAQNLHTIGRYEMRAIEYPSAVHVRNK